MRALVHGLPREVTTVEIEEANLGAAYNAAVSAATGQYLLFMDSDCRFLPGTIRMLVRQVMTNPVVKGRVEFQGSDGLLSRCIAQSRQFQIADHVNAYSPPLIYRADIVTEIGGYHYSDLIHWEEDREFDFRLQLAGIPVIESPQAIVVHAAQSGTADLRSGFRYGLGEGIGQELGLFITPWVPWRLGNDARSVVDVARRKGLLPAIYRTVWLSCYHAGTLYHLFRDPYDVRRKYPAPAARVRSRSGVPGHSTKLDSRHLELLRSEHLRQGRTIRPTESLLRFPHGK